MSTAPQTHKKTVSEVRNVAVDLRGKLDEGELLTGVPTVEEVTSSDLTLANKGINEEEITVNCQAVPVGGAVQFKVSGGSASTKYKIRITVGTDAAPPQTLVENIVLFVIPD